MTEHEIKKLAIEKFKKMVKEEEFSKVNCGYSLSTKKMWNAFIKFIREQSNNFTEENIEVIKPMAAEKVKNMSFSVRRYYRQKFSDGSLGNITMNSKIMKLNMKMLNFPKSGAVYSFKEDKYDKYNSLRNHILESYGYPIINLEIGDKIEEDLKEEVESVYRRVNEASLFNYPEKLEYMIFSDWNILETEEVDVEKDFDKHILLRFKYKGSYIKVSIGKFTTEQNLDLVYKLGKAVYGFYNDEGRYLTMKYKIFKGLIFER